MSSRHLSEILEGLEYSSSSSEVISALVDAGILDKNDEHMKNVLSNLLPTHTHEVTIRCNVEVRAGSDHKTVAAQLAADFEASPLSIEEWFSRHITEFDSF